MRIAFILHRFPVVSETFILHQITGLIDLGHDVTIFSERSPEDQAPVHAEVETYGLSRRTTYLDTQMPRESGYWSMPVLPISGQTWVPGRVESVPNFKRILDAVPVLRECLEAVPELAIQTLDPDQYGVQALSLEALYHLASLRRERRDFDVVHAHYGPVANSFRFVRALWGVPLVVSFHGWDFTKAPREHGPDLYRHLFPHADLVTVMSEYAGNTIRQLGCAADKVHTLHYGVNLAEFPFLQRGAEEHERVRILSVARLVEKKGLEYAIRAVALVHEKYPRLSFEIIGDGPLRPALEKLIQELGCQSFITLSGSADSSRVRRKLADAHLFILPSVTGADGDQEGIPVSLIEAQACGLPVLSTLHSGIPELVESGRSGFLVPERDVKALAEKLAYLIEHREIWSEMGLAGRRIIETSFDARALNHGLVALYEQAVMNYRRSCKESAHES